MVTGDHGGYVKYWQSNMNNVKMYQAHKEAIRGIRYIVVIVECIYHFVADDTSRPRQNQSQIRVAHIIPLVWVAWAVMGIYCCLINLVDRFPLGLLRIHINKAVNIATCQHIASPYWLHKF